MYCIAITFRKAQFMFEMMTLLVATVLATMISGCDRGGDEFANERFQSQHNPLLSGSLGDAKECQDRCIPLAVSMSLGELGMDPMHLGDHIAVDSRIILSKLREVSKSVGGDLKSVPLPQAIEELNTGACRAKVLVSDNGHLYILVGAYKVNGQLRYQIIHGVSSQWLVSKEQLLQGHIREVWEFERKQEGVPISVGSGDVVVSECWHNFGQVKPNRPLKHEFFFLNTGSSELLFRQPIASCNCILAKGLEETLLRPNERKPLSVTLQTGEEGLLRSAVIVPIFDNRTSKSRKIRIDLFASTRAAIVVTPQALDFGLVKRGSSIVRTIRVSEVPTDRCSRIHVDVGSMPISYSIEKRCGANGLMDYLVQLSLHNDVLLCGEKSGKLTITTDSDMRPNIVIPTKYELPRVVRISPSIVSLGTVSVGESKHVRVVFESTLGKAVNVDVSSVPSECSIKIKRLEGASEVAISTRLTKPGIWRKKITGEVKTGELKESFEINCVAYCQTP